MLGTQPQGATGQPGFSGRNRWRGRFALATRTSRLNANYVRITVAFKVSPFLPPPSPAGAEMQKRAKSNCGRERVRQWAMLAEAARSSTETLFQLKQWTGDFSDVERKTLKVTGHERNWQLETSGGWGDPWELG